VSRLGKLIILMFSLFLIFVGIAYGQDNFPFSSGDVITIIVPYSPGGGYDTNARLIQPYLEKALEEMSGVNLDVIVENKTGAGGRISHEYTYHNAAKDGTETLMGSYSNLPIWKVTGLIEWDPTELIQLAGCNLWIPAIGYDKDIEDVNGFWDIIERANKIAPTLIGGIGYANAPHYMPLVVQLFMEENNYEWPMDFIQYKGTPQAFNGVARNEVEMIFTDSSSMAPYVEQDIVKYIITFSLERLPSTPDVPTAIEQGVPDAERLTRGLLSHRGFCLPPGVPTETVEVLREAFRKALNDPDYIESAKIAGFDPVYSSAQEMEDFLKFKMEFTENYAQLFNDLFSSKPK